MTLDAYVKMDTCDSGYFQGEETLVVHAAFLFFCLASN